MNSARPWSTANWLFLPWWVAATAIGFSVGGPMEAVLGRSTGLMVVAYVSVGGSAAALLQWLVLRKHLSGVGWWVLTGVTGGAATGLVGIAGGVGAGVATGVAEGLAGGVAEGLEAGIDAGLDVAGVTAAVLAGAAFGVLQWLVLRQQVAGAGWWIPACAVAWVVSGFSAGVTDTAAGWAVLGAVYGAITGCVLVWLLRRRDDAPQASLP